MKRTEQELFDLVLKADEAAFAAGEDAKQRAWSVPLEVMRQIGYIAYVTAGPGVPVEWEVVRTSHARLYRPTDTAIGGVHLGAFMFRDVFAKITVPMVFGEVRIDPFQVTDLTPTQCQWLASRPGDYAMFVDQFVDLFDFGFGLFELGVHQPLTGDCRNLLGLAHFQLQAAAAVVTGAYDLRGATQSALIASELALKGGLAERGVSDAARKKLGHDLPALARRLADLEPRFDAARAVPALEALPAYVENRYAAVQPDRRETGRIVMTAQYVAAEVMRLFTARNFRSQTSGAPSRSWPPRGLG